MKKKKEVKSTGVWWPMDIPPLYAEFGYENGTVRTDNPDKVDLGQNR